MPSSPFGTGASCRWESFLLQHFIILSPRRNILFFAYRILHYIRYSQNKIQFIFFSFVALELHFVLSPVLPLPWRQPQEKVGVRTNIPSQSNKYFTTITQISNNKICCCEIKYIISDLNIETNT